MASVAAAVLLGACVGRPAGGATPVARTPLAPAPGARDVPALRSSAAAGAASYARHCTPCHGERGAGDGPMARALRPPPPSFADADYMRQQTPGWYYRSTTRGVTGGAMVGWDHVLDETERWDVAFFAWSRVATPEMLERGRALYDARCAACHAADGTGVGRARLDDPRRVRHSRADVAAELAAAHPELVDDLAAGARDALVEHVFTFLYAP